MTQNNIKIAITGGIGSGKSTVANFISEQGYNVISCDKIYEKLLNDASFVSMIAAEFGDVVNSTGGIDRKKLSAIVFNDKNRLNKLNSITHASIMNEALKKMSGEGLNFCEVPLLFEGNFQRLFNNAIVVLRNKSDRVASVVGRDGITENEALIRMNSQIDYGKMSFAKYYVIHNNSDLKFLYSQTLKIIEKIIKDYRF